LWSRTHLVGNFSDRVFPRYQRVVFQDRLDPLFQIGRRRDIAHVNRVEVSDGLLKGTSKKGDFRRIMRI
jgi:hypothetical protein